MIVTRFRLGFVILVAFLLQVTLFADLHPLGVAPELALLVAIHAGRVAGPERGASVGFLAGLLYDVQLETPLGLWALTGCLVAYIIGSLTQTMHRPTGALASVMTGLASAGGVVTFAVLGALVGQHQLVNTDLPRIAVSVGVLNLALSPLAGVALRWCYRPSGTLRAAA